MKAIIYPCKKISGSVAAPPSKSMAHRALVCAGLAGGISVIDNIADSEDILATMDCLRALGSKIDYDRDAMKAVVTGTDPSQRDEVSMHCKESGSTLRFLLPICALSNAPATLTGEGRLMQRPLTIYEDIFNARGISFERSNDAIRIEGIIKGGKYAVPADVSSQFISGLLFTLPLCSDHSLIKLDGSVESRPYIDMTLQALREFGIEAAWQSESELAIKGGQKYRATGTVVEGDWSNAANLMALGAEVTGIDPKSLQGDKICADYLEQLKESRVELDIADCPDLGPVLMAYAAINHGAVLRGTRRLKFKESDRGSAMKEELAKFGVAVNIEDDSIIVGSGVRPPSEILSGHSDHRIVMALAAICAQTGGTIDGAESVSKSFPDYFEKISDLGIEIRKEI